MSSKDASAKGPVRLPRPVPSDALPIRPRQSGPTPSARPFTPFLIQHSEGRVTAVSLRRQKTAIEQAMPCNDRFSREEQCPAARRRQVSAERKAGAANSPGNQIPAKNPKSKTRRPTGP